MKLAPLVEPAEELTVDEVRRYSRHIIIPEVGMAGQKRLKNAKVLCVGAGGLGSPALMYLAAAGVGTLGIVEFDTVDESNLQRQIIHGQSDIGRSKAESARDSVLEINPHVNVIVHDTRLDNDNVLEIFAGYDLIVDGTDNFATRYMVNDAACCSASRTSGARSTASRARSRCSGTSTARNYRDLYPEPPPPGMVPSCAEGGVLGVLCASIGSVMVTEAIKLITGIGDSLLGRLMVYDALEMSYRTVKIRKDPNAHEITGLIDYDAFCGTISDEAADAADRTHDLGEAAQGDARRARGRRARLRAHRRARAERVGHREHPGRGAHPQGRVPVRQGARDAAAGQAGRAALQESAAARPRCSPS